MGGNMLGCYYLHVNGDLIWKPKAVFSGVTIEEYFDSPFVQEYWIIPEKPPAESIEGQIKWTMDWLYEALCLSRDPSRTMVRIKELCERNNFPTIIFDTIVNRFKDKA